MRALTCAQIVDQLFDSQKTDPEMLQRFESRIEKGAWQAWMNEIRRRQAKGHQIERAGEDFAEWARNSRVFYSAFSLFDMAEVGMAAYHRGRAAFCCSPGGSTSSRTCCLTAEHGGQRRKLEIHRTDKQREGETE